MSTGEFTPITPAGCTFMARIETAEVPASPAVVLPTGGAGKNPIEQLVTLGFHQGVEAMRKACVEWLRTKSVAESADFYQIEAAALSQSADALEALPVPEMEA